MLTHLQVTSKLKDIGAKIAHQKERREHLRQQLAESERLLLALAGSYAALVELVQESVKTLTDGDMPLENNDGKKEEAPSGVM
jgi:chromosome condensin MukBEF ATPase and DNA-binding subunit MukB